MNWHNTSTVYLKELRDMLRDRRTLMSMIVIPTLVMPLLFFAVGAVMTKVVRQAKAETPAVMIIGGEDSPGVLAQIKADRKVRVVPTAADWKQRISDKKIRAAVEIPAGFEQGLAAGSAPAVTVYTYEGEMKSGMGAGQLERIFRELREKTVEARLSERGVPLALTKPFEVKRTNVAPPEKVGGNLIGGFIPYIIIILCFTGAMYPAMDLTAGEKERGTMETLLCSPVSRVDIVLGKFLMVLTASIATMIMSLVSMVGTFVIGGSYFAGKMSGAGAAGSAKLGGVIPLLDPLGMVGVFTMILPVAVLFSAVLLTVALFAKSYKESQSYVSPLIFVVLMPAMVGMLPGIDLNARLALVPILNLSLVCKEMLSGVWHWNYIALIFGSSCVYAAAALWLAVRMFNREDVIFRT
ncbi:ABC transporter permease [Opitutus terrae]|uniref:ABC-type Na+ efflux pump, permease component n=1 Tax=Opitutus terrae (strain DSM 11246 / JCM 15787 / PB90-1) TaxID=452637 RepID=B1ZTM7_OPITP|nr:ABC transporter permease [Opitutus terrae]ACB74813.1 ABC-type Na+ efflux pump, permease component [Opitutus terrae PB90-1]